MFLVGLLHIYSSADLG